VASRARCREIYSGLLKAPVNSSNSTTTSSSSSSRRAVARLKARVVERKPEWELQRTVAVWTVALLCLACWTGLRKRRLYDLPCHIVPLPTERGQLRSILLVLSAAMLALEVWAFQNILTVVVADASTITSTDWVTSEDHSFALPCTAMSLALVLAYRVPAVVLSIARWLLFKAGMTVLQTAVKYNKQCLAGLVISPRTAVADYHRTRPAVFGTVIAVCRLDKAAAAVCTVLRLQRTSSFFRLDKLVCTLKRICCNSEATLIEFSVVHKACEQGWDAAVVLRLLHAWMQSSPCRAAELIAAVVESKDCTAVLAILQMYGLCDTSGPDYERIVSDAMTKNASVIKRCVMWLEDCVIAVCELRAVPDGCHLADETQVLTAVAAVNTALNGHCSQERRELLLQSYTELRRAAAAVTAEAVAAGKGTGVTQYVISSVTKLWHRLFSGSTGSKPATGCKRSLVADTCVSDTHDEQQSADSRSGSICDTVNGTQHALSLQTDTLSCSMTVAASADAATTTTTLKSSSCIVKYRVRPLRERLLSAWQAFRDESTCNYSEVVQLNTATISSSNEALHSQLEQHGDNLQQAECIATEQCAMLCLRETLHERDSTVQRLDEHLYGKDTELATTQDELTNVTQQRDAATDQLSVLDAVKHESRTLRKREREQAAALQQCSDNAATAAAAASVALQHERDEHAETLRCANSKEQQLEQQLSSERSEHKLELSKRDAERDAALLQCRDDAAAATAAALATATTAAAAKLKAVTEQFEELEERSVCVVCQHDPKQVLLQPCLHLCLCVKCSISPKIKDCPICRADIDYKETVHLC
jgi:Zinc finger, C3HC4 type (RING finger)